MKKVYEQIEVDIAFREDIDVLTASPDGGTDDPYDIGSASEKL